MTPQPTTISLDELASVTGGGLGAQIGSLFGEKGAKWGGIADSIFGMIQGSGGLSNIFGGLIGGGGGGGGAPAPAAPKPAGA